MLNPHHTPLCIGGSRKTTDLLISINQTIPIYMELLRFDLDTNQPETIGVNAKELRKLHRAADRDHGSTSRGNPRTLRYPIKQTGLYRLQTVIDESKLEVRRRSSDALVVQCPTAAIQVMPHDKCKGDLSDFSLLVDATPPFQVKYSKTINGDDHGHAVLSIPGNNPVSPMIGEGESGPMANQDSSADLNLSWAQIQSSKIPLNESLGVAGMWQYKVDGVYDALGNTANHSYPYLFGSSQRAVSRSEHLEQHFFVHERPRVALSGCDAQNPIKVENGKSKFLPLQLFAAEEAISKDGVFLLRYLFTPQDDIRPDQSHSTKAGLFETSVRDHGGGKFGFEIQQPGLYSLQSVSSAFCEGEILEPSSCQLMNPLEPDLSIAAEQIPDRCAGNSIGLLVELDLLGTPPFRVYYTVKESEGSKISKVKEVDRFHTQLELKPFDAGHYVYEFLQISDVVYNEPRSLLHKSLMLEQDVRPPASARFLGAESVRKACIEEPVSFYVSLSGEPPFLLEYELLHRGRRSKRVVEDIKESIYELKTEPLTEGGDYALALTSVTDATTCRRTLDAETQFNVGLQRPRAAFGLLEGSRTMLALEHKQVTLPLRLQGESPWTLSYRRINDPASKTIEKKLRKDNDQIEVSEEGTYKIVDIRDRSCPGSIDPSANHFVVKWISRPEIKVVDSPLIEIEGGRRIRTAVCQGDEDATEIAFTGTAPFNVEYEQDYKSERGSQSLSIKQMTAGLNTASIRMETSDSGLYTYRFTKVGDASYNHDPRKFSPIDVHQRVHPRPSASFVETGKTYKYCKEEQAGGETVPINLIGMPPFHLELEIKNHANPKPERINVPNVESSLYNLHLPHRVLALGSHTVIIRKVQDFRGCQRSMDYNAPYVQVTVAELPSISPHEEHTEFCVGDRISYALSGTPPFNVYYNFQGHERKARVPRTDFRRLAEQPGEFVIVALSDARSTDACKARLEIATTIREMPSVRISKGRTSTVDIHEGGKADILFEFGGTPPFYFT